MSASPVDQVDNVTGNVSMRIPLASLPPGRAGWTMPFNLIYNSSIYSVTTAVNNLIEFSQGGS